MWTLILVTVIVSGAATGGVGTTTSFLDFADEAECRTAAQALGGTTPVTLGQVSNRPNISPSAILHIVARCVER